MAIDQSVLKALKEAVKAAKDDDPRPIPETMLAPLVAVARTGLHMHLDIEASDAIGAPVVAINDKADAKALLTVLTRRQVEVATLIIEGLPNRAIAERLGISLATVKDHVHAILARLELPSRTALVSAVNR